MVKEITVIELKAWQDKKYPHLVIDVRKDDERKIAKLEFALALHEMNEEKIFSLDKDLRIVFHCHHGGRSLKEAKKWFEQGFKNVFNLSGGIHFWSLLIDKNVPIYE